MGHSNSKSLINMYCLPKSKTPPNSASDSSDKSNSKTRRHGFKWLDGRGFKESGSPVYMLPGDDLEYVRLNKQHYILRFVWQGNYKAPLTNALQRGIKVLDAGCGTGIWSSDMAREYPKSHFTGIDVTDVFKSMPIPPNCQFLLANTLEGLPFPDNYFDFVFQRLHIFCFTREGWRDAIKELLRVLKPGGTLELMDSDCYIHDAGPSTKEFAEQLSITLNMRGVDPCMASKLKPVLEEFGLTNIKHDHRNFPLGWGPDEIGTPFKANVMSTIRSCKPQMSVVLGQIEESLEVTISAAEQEMGGEYQSYMTFDSYIVKKPDIGATE